MFHSRRGFMAATAAATLGALPLELLAVTPEGGEEKKGISPQAILSTSPGPRARSAYGRRRVRSLPAIAT